MERPWLHLLVDLIFGTHGVCFTKGYYEYFDNKGTSILFLKPNFLLILLTLNIFPFVFWEALSVRTRWVRLVFVEKNPGVASLCPPCRIGIHGGRGVKSRRFEGERNTPSN